MAKKNIEKYQALYAAIKSDDLEAVKTHIDNVTGEYDYFTGFNYSYIGIDGMNFLEYANAVEASPEIFEALLDKHRIYELLEHAAFKEKGLLFTSFKAVADETFWRGRPIVLDLIENQKWDYVRKCLEFSRDTGERDRLGNIDMYIARCLKENDAPEEFDVLINEVKLSIMSREMRETFEESAGFIKRAEVLEQEALDKQKRVQNFADATGQVYKPYTL